jgi:prolyl-tRNA synthetase
MDKDKSEKYVWQTSWGLSTRTIGALIMVHGDDKGLVLPPKITPIHGVIIPIGAEKDKKVLEKSKEVKAVLCKAGYNIEMDDRDGYTPGWKFNYWELKGIPIRIEIGPKDVKAKKIILVRRDTGKKESVDETKIVSYVKRMLEDIQKNLFNRAKKFLDNNINVVKNYSEFKDMLKKKGGFLKAGFCGSMKCEEKIKDDTTATVRAIPFKTESVKCIICRKDGKMAYFAKAY